MSAGKAAMRKAVHSEFSAYVSSRHFGATGPPTYTARCSLCGWESPGTPDVEVAGAAAKEHVAEDVQLRTVSVTLEVSVPAGTRLTDLTAKPWSSAVKGLLPEGGRVTGVAAEYREHEVEMADTGGKDGATWSRDSERMNLNPEPLRVVPQAERDALERVQKAMAGMSKEEGERFIAALKASSG